MIIFSTLSNPCLEYFSNLMPASSFNIMFILVKKRNDVPETF
jgi:hypothetical protein